MLHDLNIIVIVLLMTDTYLLWLKIFKLHLFKELLHIKQSIKINDFTDSTEWNTERLLLVTFQTSIFYGNFDFLGN